MIPGVHGRLLTASFIRDVLPAMPGVARPPQGVARHLAEWSHRIEATLGPASGARAIAEVALIPLLDLLGLAVATRTDTQGACRLSLLAGGQPGPMALATLWGESLDRCWRSTIVGAISADARWCLCCNGLALRLVDARRTWSRDYLEFDLAALGREAETQAALWALVHASAVSPDTARLDRAVDLSGQHGVQVCRALGAGVLEALEALLGALVRTSRRPAALLWEQSLTVLYRVLFLLFAEARGLVPVWHPAYRDRYSIGTIAAALLEGGSSRGLWRAVQAISRLAHAGCTSGDLRVTAFNGRLFAPAHATAFDATRLSDAVMSRALVALSSTPAGRGGRRARIVYRDLDVEQLGAVYERVLEYEPAQAGPAALTHTRDVRKSSGSFYTPRAVTAFLVRRTLEPLVKDRTADGILGLRVLDPAMGSGAFLVAACRYLASAIEEALVREGRWQTNEVTAADRVALRREVASRSLFGVDLNPMAVQLARLSIWLATLAGDKPLSFLDHHLVAGHSLIGATVDDVRRQPGGGRAKRRHEPLSLFDDADLRPALERAAQVLARVSLEPDDSAETVRRKERALLDLRSAEPSLAQWTQVLDLWCAGWFWKEASPPDRGTFLDLFGRVLNRGSALPGHVATRLLAQARDVATHHRFLHWPIAFPDVFSHEAARLPGFDAVIGNPPWDMVRGDSGGRDTRDHRRRDAHQLADFVRQSGVYQVESRAHLNLYQLFVERALQLVRPGGRVGFVVPSGLVSDAGAAPLRRLLFDRADVDEITGLDNRHAVFPVHRSVRFVLLTCTPGRPTTALRCRFGLTRVDDLEGPGTAPLILTRRFLSRLSGDDDLGIPELLTARDLAIVEAIGAGVPRLGHEGGWHVEFGRELNASDDRDLLIPVAQGSAGRRVVEGKQIEPFRVRAEESRLALRPGVATRVPRRARLAYRDVASATNRLTLIAAIVPPSVVTTHTLFCLRTPLPLTAQRVLCALVNSYVANYLIRHRVNTHVTASLVSRLPVPLLGPSHPLFTRMAALSAVLADASGSIEEMDEYADTQAIAAGLYGLSAEDFSHVLSTFPLVPAATRQRALDRFEGLGSSVSDHKPRRRGDSEA